MTPQPAYREHAGMTSVAQESQERAVLLVEVRAELAVILDRLAGHFEAEDRDDQYRLEQIETQLTRLYERVGGEAA